MQIIRIYEVIHSTKHFQMFRLFLSRRPIHDTPEEGDKTTNPGLPTQENLGSEKTGEKRKVEDFNEDQVPCKIPRFELSGESEEYDWFLPESMQEYLDKYVKIKVFRKGLERKNSTYKSHSKECTPSP